MPLLCCAIAAMVYYIGAPCAIRDLGSLSGAESVKVMVTYAVFAVFLSFALAGGLHWTRANRPGHKAQLSPPARLRSAKQRMKGAEPREPADAARTLHPRVTFTSPLAKPSAHKHDVPIINESVCGTPCTALKRDPSLLLHK